jgi:hypothetical protein
MHIQKDDFTLRVFRTSRFVSTKNARAFAKTLICIGDLAFATDFDTYFSHLDVSPENWKISQRNENIHKRKSKTKQKLSKDRFGYPQAPAGRKCQPLTFQYLDGRNTSFSTFKLPKISHLFDEKSSPVVGDAPSQMPYLIIENGMVQLSLDGGDVFLNKLKLPISNHFFDKNLSSKVEGAQN